MAGAMITPGQIDHGSRRTARDLRIAVAALICLFAIAADSAATPPQLVVRTLAGMLEFRRTPAETELLLEGNFRERLDRRAGLFARYPILGPARLIVIHRRTGEPNCPSKFQILEFDETGLAQASEPFGNCDAEPRISEVGDGLAISFRAHGDRPPAIWIYFNHSLSEKVEDGRAGSGEKPTGN